MKHDMFFLAAATAAIAAAGPRAAAETPGAGAAAPAVTVAVSPERRVLASDSPETVVVKVGLAGAALPAGDRPALNLALVIDRSGSMGGDRIQTAREAAVAAVERLDERDYVSVVVFDDRVDVIAGAQTASELNKAAIIEKILAVEARGSTAIFGGVSAGAAELRKNLARKLVNRIVLLSDGAANVGPSSPEELGRLGASLVKEGISVSTLGVGLGYNENLMAALAGRSDGNTYFIENGGDVPRIFDAELGDAFQVAARDVKLVVRFRGANPVGLVGRDGRVEDGTVSVEFNQICSRQEKYVLVRTEFPAGKDGEVRDFATAEASWTAPGSGESGTASASCAVSFSAEARKVRESTDATVVAKTVKTENAARTAEALRLSAAGDREGAKSKWRLNMSRAASARALVGSLDMKSAAVSSAAAELDADIVWDLDNERNYVEPSAGAAKGMRARSFQIENQQNTWQEGL